jgi:hypothetical protein
LTRVIAKGVGGNPFWIVLKEEDRCASSSQHEKKKFHWLRSYSKKLA